MNEKRFSNTDNGFIVDYESEQKVLNLYDVVDVLNELHEENIQLREHFIYLIAILIYTKINGFFIFVIIYQI